MGNAHPDLGYLAVICDLPNLIELRIFGLFTFGKPLREKVIEYMELSSLETVIINNFAKFRKIEDGSIVVEREESEHFEFWTVPWNYKVYYS